jgi:hypothetical protein
MTLIVGFATVGLTAALVWATLILAKATRAMDEHELRRRREEDLRKCIQLAQLIISPPIESGSPIGGLFWSTPVQPYNELLSLGKYFHDVDTKRDLERLTTRLTSSLLQAGDPFHRDAALFQSRAKLRERLVQEIVEWQRDLGNYQRGPSKSLPTGPPGT